MRKKWKTWAARGLSAVLIAAMTAVYLPAAEATEAEAATVSGSSGGTSYEGEINAMTDEEYAEFGLANSSPEEFDPADTSNPLDGYEPTAVKPSELFVAYSDNTKTKDGAAEFFVADNAMNTSADGFSLDTLDNSLFGEKALVSSGEDTDNKKYYAMAECPADIDGDGTDEVAVVALSYNQGGELAGYSFCDTIIYDYEKESQEWVARQERHDIVDKPGQGWFGEIQAKSQNAVVSITAGDFDGDGKDELAKYIPDHEEGRVFVTDYNGFQEISCNSIFFDDVFRNLEEKSWYVPIVSLSSTGISGKDHLAITVSKPADVSDNPFIMHREYEDSQLLIYNLGENGVLDKLELRFHIFQGI